MEMRGMSGELLGHIGPPEISSSISDQYQNSEKLSRTGVISESLCLPSSQAYSSTSPATTAIKDPSTTEPQSQQPKSQSLSPAFISKKRKILSALHPIAEAGVTADKSPKGSVDSQIRELIDEINGYDSLVTTSSCAGRVSVFLEGVRKGTASEAAGDDEQADNEGLIEDSSFSQDTTATTMTTTRSDHGRSKAKVTTGGKSLGGKWLFISHDPVDISSIQSTNKSNSTTSEQHTWTSLFGMLPNLSPTPFAHSPSNLPHLHRSSSASPSERQRRVIPPRLITLSFEPLILHIHCATLWYASRVLAAAQTAGFRESGILSLRWKAGREDGNMIDSGNGVLVAVRSVGLGVKSVIGIWEDNVAAAAADDDDDDEEGMGKCRAIVDETYLELLMGVVAERFQLNEERKIRFATEVKRIMTEEEYHPQKEDSRGNRGGEWEEKDARARRKRASGLRRRDEIELERRRERERDGEEQKETVDNLNIF